MQNVCGTQAPYFNFEQSLWCYGDDIIENENVFVLALDDTVLATTRLVNLHLPVYNNRGNNSSTNADIYGTFVMEYSHCEGSPGLFIGCIQWRKSGWNSGRTQVWIKKAWLGARGEV